MFGIPVRGKTPKLPVTPLEIAAGNGRWGIGPGQKKSSAKRKIGKNIPLDRMVVSRKSRKDAGGLGLRFGGVIVDPLIQSERFPIVRKKGKRRRGRQS